MVAKERAASKKGGEVDAAEAKEYKESYDGLVKLVVKAGEGVKK
jgi:hypothetical protein